MTTKPAVTLGRSGPRVFPLALGCMGMGAGSWYAVEVAALEAAVPAGELFGTRYPEAGVRMLDSER